MFNWYNINSLSIARVRQIKESHNRIFGIEETEFSTFVLNKEKKIKIVGSYDRVPTRYDIINNSCYIEFKTLDYFDMSNNQNLLYIMDLELLRNYLKLDANVKRISKKELITIYNQLNNLAPKKEKIEETKKDVNNITNPFFIEILRLRTIITESTSDEKKDIYIKKLTKIGKDYTETLINNYEKIKYNPDYEFEILNNFLSLLSDLELEISNNNQLSDYERNLLNDFNAFQSIITEEPAKLNLTQNSNKNQYKR